MRVRGHVMRGNRNLKLLLVIDTNKDKGQGTAVLLRQVRLDAFKDAEGERLIDLYPLLHHAQLL